MTMLTDQIPPTTTTTTPSAVSTPPPAAAGVATPSWRDSLPEDLKSNATLGLYSDVASLAKAHVHTQALVGKKGVFVPGDKATDEEWGNFYKSIGVPDADKYAITPPEGKSVNENMINWFKENAQKNGLLPKQAQNLLNNYLEFEEQNISSKVKEIDTEAQEQLTNLKKEWGEGYGKQIALAKLAVNELGGPDFGKYLEETGLGNDVQIVKLMSKVGKLLGEDKLRGDGSGNFGKTPEESKKAIGQIMNDKNSPYWDANHPGHKQAVAEVEAHYKSMSS